MSILKKKHLFNMFHKYPLYFSHLVFYKLRLFKRYQWIKMNSQKNAKVPLPFVFELTPTLKCNLRCKMCMLWGDAGWCNNKLSNYEKDLEWELVERLFSQVGKYHPSFILNGGEPLLYSHFSGLTRILKKNRCFSIVCTNGYFLDKFKEDISGNPYLTFLVSLDGLENENDAIRGKGVHKKVIENIKLLKSAKNAPFIGIQFTILPENVANIYEFCKEMVNLGVDWILLNPTWFITEQQARKYEDFMKDHFSVSPKTHRGYILPYDLDTDEFAKQYLKIKNEQWPIQISCYLNDPEEDIHAYKNSDGLYKQGGFCYKQWIRMDITPSGQVTPCIRFPDLAFGDLHTQDALGIWNSPSFVEFRELIRKNSLPICNKCNSIYLYDGKRKYL